MSDGPTIDVDRSASLSVQFRQAFAQSIVAVAPYVLGWTFGIGAVLSVAAVPIASAYLGGQWVLHQTGPDWLLWPGATLVAVGAFALGTIIVGSVAVALARMIGLDGEDSEQSGGDR